jgi:hypothetical protein
MVELVEPAEPSSTLVLVVESSVVLVEASTKLILVRVSSSALELVEAAMLVEVSSSTLVPEVIRVADSDEVSAVAEFAADPEVWSSPPSLDAHATPTRRRAAPTAVSTPSTFLNI